VRTDAEEGLLGRPAQRHVGEDDVRLVLLADEVHADQPPNRAVRAVGPHDVLCPARAAVAEAQCHTVGVLVEVSYAGGGRNWSDTLNLERTPDSWLLNNVFYEGGGNLRFRLAALVP